MSDFTVVLGVDRRHLAELSWAMRTWTKHKPQIFKHPFLVFYDYKDLTHGEVFQTLQNASGDKIDLKTTRYPDRSLPDAVWDLGIKDRWHDPVRNRMLSGFVHVPAQMVETRYWLKLDTDTLAKDDQWFPKDLLESNAQIIAHPWGYTKPGDQIEKLDKWGNRIPELKNYPELGLRPNPGSSMVRCKRIISWCGFFSTEFTKDVRQMCLGSCGRDRIPVPSQDGLMWYVAKRSGAHIVRCNMKKLGWDHVNKVESKAREILGE